MRTGGHGRDGDGPARGGGKAARVVRHSSRLAPRGDAERRGSGDGSPLVVQEHLGEGMVQEQVPCAEALLAETATKVCSLLKGC